MVFDVSVALTWILFLALFPMAFFWLRAAWRIAVNKDYSDVAVKHGVSPSNPAKFAPYAFLINLVTGGIAVFVIGSVLAGQLPYETWSAIAGVTIWFKIIANFILTRHAHPIVLKKKA